jgi:hypothetical protein
MVQYGKGREYRGLFYGYRMASRSNSKRAGPWDPARLWFREAIDCAMADQAMRA